MFFPKLPVLTIPAIGKAFGPHNWTPDSLIFFGTAADDTFQGGSSNDIMWGSDGADTFHGGKGSDTINYSRSSEGVSVDLENGRGNGGHAEGDRYVSVENVVGSAYDDHIIGSSADNWIHAGLGDDKIILSAGSDTIDGGGGFDTILGVADNTTIDLASGTGSGGIALGDRYYGIEHAGLYGDDNTIIGDDGFNILYGRGNNFTASGGDGDDVFVLVPRGGAIDGGSGYDALDFSLFDNTLSGTSAALSGVVVDLAGGEVRENQFGPTAVTTITGIEAAAGTSANDVFYDSTADNEFLGYGGSDVFVFDHDGGGESDRVHGFEIGVDLIDLSDTRVRSYNDLMDGGSRRLEQDGSNTVIHTGNGNEIVLSNVTATDLNISDFLF